MRRLGASLEILDRSSPRRHLTSADREAKTEAQLLPAAAATMAYDIGAAAASSACGPMCATTRSYVAAAPLQPAPPPLPQPAEASPAAPAASPSTPPGALARPGSRTARSHCSCTARAFSPSRPGAAALCDRRRPPVPSLRKVWCGRGHGAPLSQPLKGPPGRACYTTRHQRTVQRNPAFHLRGRWEMAFGTRGRCHRKGATRPALPRPPEALPCSPRLPHDPRGTPLRSGAHHCKRRSGEIQGVVMALWAGKPPTPTLTSTAPTPSPRLAPLTPRRRACVACGADAAAAVGPQDHRVRREARRARPTCSSSSTSPSHGLPAARCAALVVSNPQRTPTAGYVGLRLTTYTTSYRCRSAATAGPSPSGWSTSICTATPAHVPPPRQPPPRLSSPSRRCRSPPAA